MHICNNRTCFNGDNGLQKNELKKRCRNKNE